MATREEMLAAIERFEKRAYRKEWATPKRERPSCGAKTRSGAPCQAKPVWDRKANRPVNGRCRNHGGLSTGPRTEEGKAKAAANLR